MKITIDSTHILDDYFLIDLYGNKIAFENDKTFDLGEGWHELNIPYTGQQNEITDVKINDHSIGYLLHTSFYIDGLGKRHQPASAIWDQNGVMKLWLHTNLGYFFQRVLGEIDNGDFGRNLLEKYVFTVDRPLNLQTKFPEDIDKFFAYGDGPHWWKLGTDYTPYRTLDIDLPLQDEILNECNRICIYEKKAFDSVMDLKTICRDQSDLPFKQVDWSKAPMLKKLLMEQIGYKNIIDISVQTLKPNSYLPLHRDDHYNRKKYNLIRGCKKMYWPLKGDWSKNYFKLGKSGIVPFNNKPCMINTIEHVHTAVNESDLSRTILIVYGDLPDDK